MPPSPGASSTDELFQHGLHHIVQHNSNASYPKQERYDETMHMLSGYGSPGPEGGYIYNGQQYNFPYQYPQQDLGLGNPYDQFDGSYKPSLYRAQYSTPATSPPTPSTSLPGPRTRSGMEFRRQHQLKSMPESRSRDAKTSKPKKAKKDKSKAENKVVKLDKPLSELTKDWTHVPIVDIEAYVNRSAEERQREVEEGKVPGKVKRPMNSFMLYRKAYQNRTKDWCLQNNHQVVSQVCGDSWPLEPDEVKDKFSEWARIERINHQNAHPGYKFSPSKPGTVKAIAKRRFSQDTVSEASDLSDYEWQDPSYRKQRKRSKPRQLVNSKYDQGVPYPSQRSAYLYSRENSLEANHGAHRSSYQVNNPGQPLPMPYNESVLRHGEYYQQSIAQNTQFPGGAQDILMRRTAAPNIQSQFQLGVAVPGRGVQDFETYPQFEFEQREHILDPSLMPQQHIMYQNSIYGNDLNTKTVYYDDVTGSQWPQQLPSRHHDPVMPLVDPQLRREEPHIDDRQVRTSKGAPEEWHAGTLDGGGEFDKWMPDDENGTSPP